jgi:hypothetical protein
VIAEEMVFCKWDVDFFVAESDLESRELIHIDIFYILSVIQYDSYFC